MSSFLSLVLPRPSKPQLFSFNDTATTEIYTLSLHDALPISGGESRLHRRRLRQLSADDRADRDHNLHPSGASVPLRSEKHTSELQSQSNLVCRLLLEKKKKSE